MSFGVRQNINFLKVLLGKPAPIYVQLALSKACNMRCRMCNAVHARKHEQELDLDDIARLAYVLRKMGVGLIILTGGEPLIRNDIVDVVRVFKKEHFTVRMQSNGLLFSKELLESLRDAGLSGITVSLHSLSEEKMAFVTNVSDALPRVLSAICLYNSIFKSPGQLLGINTVVSALNIEEIPQIVQFVDQLGFTTSLIPVHLSQEHQFIVRQPDDASRFSQDIFPVVDKVYDQLIEMKHAGISIYNSEHFLSECPEFLKHGKTSWKCESPDLYFSISPDGTFLPCVDLQGSNSMLDPQFMKKWSSATFKRDIRHQVQSCKGCMYACYPEFSNMLHSKRFFLERLLDFRRMTSRSWRPLTMDDVNSALSSATSRTEGSLL